MPRLSSPVDELKDHYTVVVIGSGYGGAIAASRLARAGQQVCILERGREFQPGEYPDTELEALGEMQAQTPAGHTGSRAGLYEFNVNPDVNVFVGCGLGGTSLINGSVALKAEPRVFEDPRWPRELRDDPAGLEEGYRRAQDMLRPVEYPAQYPELPKLEALEKSAAQLGRTCQRAPIAVSFTEGVNHVGVAQHACQLCGDCISGCNYGAKNTLLFNYLPDARNFGAEIYTRICVRRLERKDGRWLVHYQVLETGLEGFDAPARAVSADVVVLAAGALGSTEILLRSKAAGLPLSGQVGNHFSGNGDVLGYSYGCADEIRGVGYGHRDVRELEAVGPCVTGLVDLRGQPELNDGMVIQEIATPGALAGLLPLALAKTGSALSQHTGEDLDQAMAMEESEVEDLLLGPYEAAANNTQAYLVTTHEAGSGRMRLENDRLHIEWPNAGQQPILEKVNATLAEATRPLGGSYRINPLWSTLFHRDLITVHPLGGCVMAANAADGVVNHKGQVYSGAGGTDAYAGLYVCDGSVIPRSLGAGPLLTISALSERACALLARDRGWRIDYTFPSRAVEPPRPAPLGIQFTETMAGDSMELSLTVVSGGLEEMLRNPDRKARVTGRVAIPALAEEPLTVTGGEFSLGQKTYRMSLSDGAGQAYYLHGFRESATLQVTVYERDSEAGPVRGKATLRATPRDLRQQLATLLVLNAADSRERLKAMERFGRALAGELYDIYGSVVGGRKRRPLRVNAPSVYPLPAGGGAPARLIRYEGGSKGPVMLAASPGVPALLFSLDTIETNLVEFLFARGYDVWLLDSSSDYPHDTATGQIRQTAGARQVRTVAGGWEFAGRNAAQEVYPRLAAALEAEHRAFSAAAPKR